MTPKEALTDYLMSIMIEYNLPPIVCDNIAKINRNAIEAARIVERERCAEIVKGRIRKRKPTHGTCCTCQVCGGSNDDICDCSMNSVLEEIEQKILSPNQDNI